MYEHRDSSPAGQPYDDNRTSFGAPSDAGSSSAAGPSRAGAGGTTATAAAADEATSSAQKRRDQLEEKTRRAYRACTNCRTRKAKCDLGDIDNPKDPPCARCKREKRECTFLPSRRGGNLAAKAKAKLESADDDQDAFAHETGSFSTQRRTSFASGSTDGSATKRIKLDDGQPAPPSRAQDEEASRPRSTSNISSWSANDLLPTDTNLDLWSGMLLSGTNNRSPLPGTGTLPTMQTSPLSFTTHLTAPNFQTGSSATPASRNSFSGAARPSIPSPYQAFANQQVSPTASMPPPPGRTSPIFGTQTAYASKGPLESPIFGHQSDLATGPSAFPPPQPPPASTLPAPQPPPSKSAPPRRPATSVATSRPENFITAGMANEADALSLLALTATGEKPKGSGKSPGAASEPADTPDGRQSERSLRSDGSSHRRVASVHAGDGTGAFEAQARNLDEHGHSDVEDEEEMEQEERPPPSLSESDLICKGVLTAELLVKYVDWFFRRHHQIFPMIPASRKPKTELDLQRFAQDEKHLLAAMVIIASRHDAEHPLVHEKAWEVMSTYINTCVVKGRETCVGFVESMLLLSENLPRQEDKDDVVAKTTADTKTWDDSTQSWFFVGHAVRTGYLLGLDQQTLYIDPTAPTTPELDRERLAWTYCYLFDRHISLRIGKAFWSRGPGLCFTPNDAFANFPSLRPISGEQSDLASVVQALVELTQQMTTAHDVLYPSKDRTVSLVRAGEYYKYLSDFSRSINGFEAVWRPKTDSWSFPCSEIIWSTFHYLRLYIYAFAFQAHVQRADEQGLSAHSKFGGLFPRGTTQSPDAKFIFESIDAAKQLLELATERLHPGGALPYVPARIFGWISFASSFLLKAVYSGAVAEADAQNVVELIQKVIFCLANSSPDKQHLGIRHALLLRTVMKQLKTAFHTAEWVSHAGTATPLFPERWHIPISRPASPERSTPGGMPQQLGSLPSALPPSPWPGGLAAHQQPLSSSSHLPSGGFGTPSIHPDAHAGNGGDVRTSQDWLSGFGDLLGDTSLGGAGSGGVDGNNGLGELAFLDMELGSSWWTNVLPPEGNQGR